MKQKPPTAKGCAFFVLEDRSTRLQVLIVPELWEAHRRLLRDARALRAELDVTFGVRGYAYA